MSPTKTLMLGIDANGNPVTPRVEILDDDSFAMVMVDPQADAWDDDGTESGAMRVRVVRGDVVPIPFDSGNYYAEIIGSATAAQQTTGVYTNPDGSGSSINVSVPAGLTQGMRIWVPFYGRAFGIRWRRDTATCPNISVIVDGQAVMVATGYSDRLTIEGLTTQMSTDAEARAMTHDHLAGGAHMAEIVIASDPSLTTTITLYGYLGDERAGYRQLPRLGHLFTTVAVPTTSTEIATGRATSLNMRSVRSVVYTNTSGAAVIVTVYNNTTVLWAKSIAAGDSAVLDFGSPISATANLKHMAGAAGVNYSVIGEY